MLKKAITYTDFEGKVRTETFYFHLSQLELSELEASAKGGLQNQIKKIVETEDQAELIKIFKDIILRSVGKRSDDNRRFIKNDEVRNDFAETEAFSALFLELATDSNAAANFINGIVAQPVASNKA